MFRGHHTHTIDTKGRVSVPAKFREIITQKHGSRLIVTNGLDRCLVAYPPDAWRALEEKVLQGPIMEKGVTQFVRFFMSGAVDCLVDGQGRILIPPHLRDHAGLNKDVLFVGMLTWIELWDRDQWNRVYPQDEMQIHEMRQTMAKLGW